MKLKTILLPLLVLSLSACGGGNGGSDDPVVPPAPEKIKVTVVEGNAIKGNVDETVTETACVLSTVLSTDTTKGDYNSVILGNAKGYIAVSTYGLDATVVGAWKDVKVGDTVTFSGKIAASTGGEFGKGGNKQIYPTSVAVETEIDKQLECSFAEVKASNIVDLSDIVIDDSGNVTTQSENFRKWYDTFASETDLFGVRVTFKNVKIDAAADKLPGEGNTNQGYFMSSKKLIDETVGEKTSAIRASIYHATLPADFDVTAKYDITAVNYGANNPIHTAGQKAILRFGVAPAMVVTKLAA